MKCVTPNDMKRIEEKAEVDGVISRCEMMRLAGEALGQYIADKYPQGGVLVLCGRGNNGGDGVVCAEVLHNSGRDVTLCFIYDSVHSSELSIYYLRQFKGNIISNADADTVKTLLGKNAVCVDCIFGTGFCGYPDERAASVIKAVNDSGIQVVSADIPSGINAHTGEAPFAVRADDTVTFGAIKRGTVFYPAREYTGTLSLAPIGIPEGYFLSPCGLITEADAAAMLRVRPRNAHKGIFGRLAVIGGSIGMTGAPCMAAMAALRAGVGMITLGVPATLNTIFEIKLTEQMTRPLADDGGGHIMACEALDALVAGSDAVAMGMGLSRTECTSDAVKAVLKSSAPLLLDADALWTIAQTGGIPERDAPTVITPHIGEMARLTGKKIDDIVTSQYDAAYDYAVGRNVTVVLKSDVTVIASPDGRVSLNTAGCSAMAKGGSGDVLAGVISSLLAQGYAAFDAASLGVFITGMAGELAAGRYGSISAAPTDTISCIGEALDKLIAVKQEQNT